MGLRINTNINALRALRNLQINDRLQARSLERLSTGLRINRASDDPAGLVISEQLRGQINALERAVENSQNASNLIATADSAIQEISNLIAGIESSLVFVQNTGGASEEQIAAEQNTVDAAIASIDRIVATTRFAGRNLINGVAEFILTQDIPSQIQNIVIRSMTFPGGQFERDVTIEITDLPERARVQIQGASSPAGATIRISGPKGTEDVFVASGAQAADIAKAINSVAPFTGAFASGVDGAANYLRVFSEGYGKDEVVRLQIVAGSVSGPGGTLAAGTVLSDQGVDAVITYEGQQFTGIGNAFSITTRIANFSFELNPDPRPGDSRYPNMSVGDTYTFTVGNTGLTFQLNEMPSDTDRIAIGIPNLATAELGFEQIRDLLAEAVQGGSMPSGNLAVPSYIRVGGYLNTIKTGGENSLVNNPANATQIVKYATNQAASIRGFLGAIQAGSLEPNINSVGVHIENLSSSLSMIRDLDFAAETANFTRSQILFQSTIAVLASANLIPQSVLALLG
jgi:flagellin